MVAALKDRSRALLGTAVLAVLLASSLPPTSGQTIPTVDPIDTPGWDLEVRPGELVIRNTANTARNLSFLSGNTSYIVEFPVYNTGAAEVPTGIPVWVWFDENRTGDPSHGKIGSAMFCTRIQNAAGTQLTVPRATSVPGRVVSAFTLDVRRISDAFRDDAGEVTQWVNGYTMRVLVNRDPDSVPGYPQPRPSNCPAVKAPTGVDEDPRDNMIVGHFVKDSRQDLQVTAIKWCRGEAHLAAGYDQTIDRYRNERVCDTGAHEDTRFLNYTSTMTGPGDAVYNTTRKHENATCPRTELRCREYYNVPNATYFEIKVENSEEATWTGTEDFGAEGCVQRPTDTTTCVAPDGTVYDVDDRGARCLVVPQSVATVATNGKSWYNLTVDECPGYAFEYDLRISNLTQDPSNTLQSFSLTNASLTPRGSYARSVTWHVINWTGPFKVFANVNHRDSFRFPEAVAGGNSLIHPDPTPDPEAPPQFPYEVAWTDLEPEFLTGGASNLKTSPADPYPYEPDSQIDISFSVLLKNHGTAEPTLVSWDAETPDELAPGGQDQPGTPVYKAKPIRWVAFLDGKIVGASIAGTVNAIGNATTQQQALGAHYANGTFQNWTTVGHENEIKPGRHTLCIRLDSLDVARETNESNNEKCVDIFVEDTDAPEFLPLDLGQARPRLTHVAARNGTAIDHARPAETFWVHANITDNDIPGVTAYAQFTLVDNTSITRNYTMNKHLQYADVDDATTGDKIRTFTTGRITNFTFESENGTTENWTMKVIARDASGGEVQSASQPFQLVRWGIQTKNESHIVLGIPKPDGTYDGNDKEYPYGASNVVIFWEIEVFSNETGIVNPATNQIDQSNVTDNLGLYVFAPNGQTFYVNGTNATTGAGWQKLIRCTRSELPVGGAQGPDVCTNMNRFQSPYISKELGGPGRWYVNINITDVAGDVRSINRTFVLKDSLPILTNHSISATELNAGEELRVVVNMTDDFDIDVDNGGAMVNFTRTRDNRTFSVPLVEKTSASFGGRTNYTYNDTITTGFGNELDEAGEFLVRFVARDTQGNWNATPPLTFTLKDSAAPNVLSAGVDQPLQEIGLNVTFLAHVTDETNVTVRLRVHPSGSDEDVFAVNMTPTELHSRNYTWEANFTREGSYIWEIFAIDSSLQTSSVKTGLLTIASNLGPRFEIREPNVLVNGQRYSDADPRFVLLVYDTDGVDKASIELKIAGQNATPAEPVPAPAGINGYYVNYSVPSSARFNHGDVITVNLTAVDTSDKLLRGFLNFTLVVDARPPTVVVKSFAPRFPLEGTFNVTVSLRTQFTLEAQDDDGLPTGIESIRYRILGGGNNTGEFVYNGPFTILDAPRVYNGPKAYAIQYWAVDAVGNQKGDEQLSVFVDDIPPSLDLLGSLPQGRYINATFIDTRSGVDRALVWYSVNGAAYQVIALDFVAGVWTTVLPEGRKGDRISYYLEAFDRVGNRETFGNVTEPYSTYTVGNHLPTIRITAPVEGSRLARTVDVTWTAADEDGDPLVFTVYLRAPGRATFTELTRFESSDTRRYPFDSTKYPDGEYTIRITASDGSFVALAETTVSILNRASAFGVPGAVPESVRVGQPVLLTVEVTKAQAVVEARVFRDGVLVDAYPMNDEGRDGDVVANDGKYSVRVPMDANGRYSVEFHATYQEDGVQKEATLKGADFVVERAGLPGGIGLWLVLVGLLVVAGVGVAAFVLLRRR